MAGWPLSGLPLTAALIIAPSCFVFRPPPVTSRKSVIVFSVLCKEFSAANDAPRAGQLRGQAICQWQLEAMYLRYSVKQYALHALNRSVLYVQVVQELIFDSCLYDAMDAYATRSRPPNPWGVYLDRAAKRGNCGGNPCTASVRIVIPYL